MPQKAHVSFRKGFLSVLLAFVSFSLGMIVEAVQRHEGISGWTLWVDNLAAALLLKRFPQPHVQAGFPAVPSRYAGLRREWY